MILLIRSLQYDPETEEGFFYRDLKDYMDAIHIDRLALHRLVEAEVDVAKENMEAALNEAKENLAQMEEFLNANGNKVKAFLED